MPTDKPRITATVAGRPLHPIFRPFAIGYFLAALGCDLLYAQAGTFARAGASDFGAITVWLLAAGLVMAGLATAAALVDFLGERRFRDLPDLKTHAAGSALVIALEAYNLQLRVAGGAETIAPTGLILSLAAVAVLLATPSKAWSRMYR